MRKVVDNWQLIVDRIKLVNLLLVACCLLSLFASSQKVTTNTNKSTIRIGEQFELQLTVEPTNNSSVLINTWFNIPDSIQHFEVLQRLPIDTLDVDGIKSYSQKILLTSYDTGTYPLPIFAVVMIDKKNITTQPLPIKVLPVNISNMQDYHDIKEIIDVEPETDWWFWGKIAVGIIFTLIILYFIITYLIKKKPAKLIKQKAVSIEAILQQIDALQPLINNHQYKPLFTQLISITRQFCDVQLQTTTLTKTTDEYMVLLKGKVGNEPTQVQYYQLLRLADAVKFAKFKPVESECVQALATAKTFVQTMYSYTFKPKANAV
jgi:hypothetical protein